MSCRQCRHVAATGGGGWGRRQRRRGVGGPVNIRTADKLHDRGDGVQARSPGMSWPLPPGPAGCAACYLAATAAAAAVCGSRAIATTAGLREAGRRPAPGAASGLHRGGRAAHACRLAASGPRGQAARGGGLWPEPACVWPTWPCPPHHHQANGLSSTSSDGPPPATDADKPQHHHRVRLRRVMWPRRAGPIGPSCEAPACSAVCPTPAAAAGGRRPCGCEAHHFRSVPSAAHWQWWSGEQVFASLQEARRCCRGGA